MNSGRLHTERAQKQRIDGSVSVWLWLLRLLPLGGFVGCSNLALWGALIRWLGGVGRAGCHCQGVSCSYRAWACCLGVSYRAWGLGRIVRFYTGHVGADGDLGMGHVGAHRNLRE